MVVPLQPAFMHAAQSADALLTVVAATQQAETPAAALAVAQRQRQARCVLLPVTWPALKPPYGCKGHWLFVAACTACWCYQSRRRLLMVFILHAPILWPAGCGGVRRWRAHLCWRPGRDAGAAPLRPRAAGRLPGEQAGNTRGCVAWVLHLCMHAGWHLCMHACWAAQHGAGVTSRAGSFHSL